MRNHVFKSTVQGIPCQIEVTHYKFEAPSRFAAIYCDNPDEYYGFVEFEFNVLDRKGYYADWLEKKLTDDDYARILEEHQRDLIDY